MKQKILSITVAIGSTLAALALVMSPVTAANISAPAKSALLEALDDEYKAFATYKSVMAKFGSAKPFSNIIKAETKHASELKTLMNKYGVSVPGNKYMSGSTSTIKTPATLKASCELGVHAEIENVKLYDDKLLPAVSSYSDITRVMKALRDASQDRHLPAFNKCVARGGKMGGGR